MTYYEVGKPTTTYYTPFVVSIMTWKALADQGAKTWAQLKDLGLTTWEELGGAKGTIMFYYAVPEPSTIYYEVTVS